MSTHELGRRCSCRTDLAAVAAGRELRDGCFDDSLRAIEGDFLEPYAEPGVRQMLDAFTRVSQALIDGYLPLCVDAPQAVRAGAARAS